jgi:prepilin-type processing-associated H-X9-DG protein
MKCISICQPYASAIIFGPKRVENRTWTTRHRGRLLIHAGKSNAWWADGSRAVRELWPDYGVERFEHELRGCIIGFVELIHCTQWSPANAARLGPWAFGPWCWELANPVMFGTAIPYRGSMGLFDVPLDVVGEEIAKHDRRQDQSAANAVNYWST